jgi:hypothetical protein
MRSVLHWDNFSESIKCYIGSYNHNANMEVLIQDIDLGTMDQWTTLERATFLDWLHFDILGILVSKPFQSGSYRDEQLKRLYSRLDSWYDSWVLAIHHKVPYRGYRDDLYSLYRLMG